MGKIYNNLISTTAGFNYASQQPLDDREVVQSHEDLDALVSSYSSYKGMRVYVVDDQKSYELSANNTWTPIATETYVTQMIEEIEPKPIPDVEGATESEEGERGLVPAPVIDDRSKYLKGSGKWEDIHASEVHVNNKTLLDYLPVILTQNDYEKLLNGETIEVSGETIEFEENRIYMIVQSDAINN